MLIVIVKLNFVARAVDYTKKKYISSNTNLESTLQAKQNQYQQSLKSDLWVYQYQVQQHFFDLIPNNSCIFIGDSIINKLNTKQIYNTAINMGIFGETSAGLHTRIKDMKDLVNNYEKIKILFIHIGINDMQFGEFGDKILIKNISDIIDLKPKNARLIVSDIFPVDERLNINDFIGYNARIKIINMQLKSLCNKNSNCYFSEFGRNLLDGSGNLAIDHHIKNDPVHISAKAYDLWQEDIKALLKNIY